jgi:hypothetical protein
MARKQKGWEYYLAIILSIIGILAIVAIALRALGVI